MNREIIEQVFDDIINNVTIKCGRVSARATVKNAFMEISKKYGLKLHEQKTTKENRVTPTNDGLNYNVVYTLTDEEHNTTLTFTEKFLDDNKIAFHPQGNHKNHHITLEELIEGYTKLPNNNKDSINNILFKYLGDKEEVDTNVLASSKFEDISAKEMNTITIPSYYFDVYNPTGDGWDNYDFLIAHESMHCLDYRTMPDREYTLKKKEMTTLDLTPSEYEELSKIKETAPYHMEKSTGEYMKSNGKNLDYLGWERLEELVDPYNKASDYGATEFCEDYAEAGAMVINGFHNPDNPKAVVRWNGDTMQYREWIKLHPYKAQYLVKEIYDEDVSIEDLLSQRIDTPRNELPIK